MKGLSARTGLILVLWHGVTMLPIYHCRGRGYWTIISPSRDGDLQDRLVRSRGYNTIRGSSSRSAVKALLEAVRTLNKGAVLALTPDGPKGPPKVVQQGTVHLAQRSGCPVVPVGVACYPARRIGSWDSHMVPMPFARACIVFGEPLWFSRDDTVSQAELAGMIADAICAADAEAERILAEGRS